MRVGIRETFDTTEGRVLGGLVLLFAILFAHVGLQNRKIKGSREPLVEQVYTLRDSLSVLSDSIFELTDSILFLRMREGELYRVVEQQVITIDSFMVVDTVRVVRQVPVPRPGQAPGPGAPRVGVVPAPQPRPAPPVAPRTAIAPPPQVIVRPVVVRTEGRVNVTHAGSITINWGGQPPPPH
jgi:hypothetical protein